MDFTQGKIGKQIMIFSIPLILGNLFQQMYTLVNSVFVGNYLGKSELAAVGSVYPVVFFITSMILGIGGGGSIVVSHYYGAKDLKTIPKVISTFYIFFIVLGLVICGGGIVFAKNIFSLLNLQNDVKDMAVLYFRIYMAGMFFSVLFHSVISILRGLGDSVTQLYFLIPANILNIVLSYVFLGPLHYGVAASAWASVIAQFLAFASILIYLGKNHELLRLSVSEGLCFEKKYLKQIVDIGLPSGLQQGIVSLTQILTLYLVGLFGTNANAAFSAGSRIESIALLLILNISQALTSFVGTNLGAGQTKRAKQGLRSSLYITIAVSLLVFLAFCLLGKQLIGLFIDDCAVIEIGKQYLMVDGLFWALFGFMMMFTAYFRGAGHTMVTMIISLVTLWIVRFPVSWYLCQTFGTLGIWLGAPIAWLLSVIIYVLYYKTKQIKGSKIVPVLCFLVSASVLFCLSVPNCHSQNKGKDLKTIFSSPLKLPLSSAGSFAELRGSHFHSGLDLRTMGRTGFNVYAPYEGYVSRIKVQAYGGGKNLYITHPNGYTTVYMHLERYCGEIEKFVKNYQYSHHVYEMDYTFGKPTIYLKQGDTIAISGQSGAAAGPHLHYEIRKTGSQNPLNPLLFTDISDVVPPYISSMAICPIENSHVDYMQEPKIVNFDKDTIFKDKDTIDCLGKIFFSLYAYGSTKKSDAKNGVLATELFVDGNKIFSHKIDELSFSNYGYADAVTDYPLYIKTGKRYLCSRLKSNGKLPYDTYVNNGVLDVKQDSVYKVEWKLKDYYFDSTVFSFYIRGVQTEDSVYEKDVKPRVMDIDCMVNESYTASDGSVFIFPRNCLYETISLEHFESKGTYGDIHRLHNIYEPVKKSFPIKLKPYNLEDSLKQKYLIVRIDSKGRKKSVGGYCKDGFVQTKVGDFGTFAIWIDTTAPKIKPLNFHSNRKLTKKQKSLQVRISDNLSGIDQYDAYLNNKWVLMEYDGKNSKLVYSIDQQLKKGANTLKIVVKDKCNNVRTETFKIVKP